MYADTMTVGEAREELLQHVADGTHCPCCEQYVKQYKRKLNVGMARFLILLAKKSSGQNPWLYVVDIFKNDDHPHPIRWGDYGKLRFWGLVESKDDLGKGGKSAGYWRITEKGYQFLMGEIRVFKHIYSLNNKLVGFSSETIDIHDALGEHFDYYELMAA